ncbi:MAG: hypothetical protein EZS28_013933 [Streblomastix strix]|uniref:Uncharacterized protein n=1 Tax=Streblomastix strix TaxID=222440 RepID=A0A5J4W6G4_9EUKA|nr:MAG: hypothetical protein EZS28_013933 [Streblomastix strix]
MNVHKSNFRVDIQFRFKINVSVLCSSLYCCSNFVSRSVRTWSKARIGCAGGLLCFGGFLRVTKSVAALARCLASTTCSSDGYSAQKPICNVSCPDSPAKSTRPAVIAFGSTSSGAAIVQSWSSGSISKFQRNAFTYVGCGCVAICSGFCGTKFAQFGVQYESLLNQLLNIVKNEKQREKQNQQSNSCKRDFYVSSFDDSYNSMDLDQQRKLIDDNYDSDEPDYEDYYSPMESVIRSLYCLSTSEFGIKYILHSRNVGQLAFNFYQHPSPVILNAVMGIMGSLRR